MRFDAAREKEGSRKPEKAGYGVMSIGPVDGSLL